jgi:hypothetical protein
MKLWVVEADFKFRRCVSEHIRYIIQAPDRETAKKIAMVAVQKQHNSLMGADKFTYRVKEPVWGTDKCIQVYHDYWEG